MAEAQLGEGQGVHLLQHLGGFPLQLLLDVRVLEAVERALKTGQVQTLEPYQRKRRPAMDQVEKLRGVGEPELVGAHKPSEGQ